MSSRDDATTRAASYAAGAMTPAERREFEAEVARDPRLAEETREFAETAAALGLAPAPVEPSAELRARLLDQIGRVEQVPAPVVGLPRRPPTRPLAAIVAVAAAVVLIGGTVTATTLLRDSTPSAVEQITAAPDYERASADVNGGGSVTLVWSESLASAAIVVDDLAPAPAGRTYQMWYIDEEGAATPAGTFDRADGRGIALRGDMDPGDTIGITIEPDGGSDAPTTTPIVVIPTA